MGKRNKQTRPATTAASQRNPPEDAPPAIVADPPAKNLKLLAISVGLFAAWFLFLLVTALLSQR